MGALELAQAACRTDPDSELACHALAEALSGVGRDHEALDAIERGARGPWPSWARPSWLMRRAQVLVRLGRLGDAENSAAAAFAIAAGLMGIVQSGL